MTRNLKFLVFAGSLRTDSLNKKLAKIAAAEAEKAGVDVTYLDLKELPLPLYDEDIECSEGIPANVRKLKDMMISSDAFIVASPEYNSYFSGVLKNLLDWASRPVEGYPPFECFRDKKALLLSATPGRFGGLRSMLHLRLLLSHMKMMVTSDQFSMSAADKEFDSDGNLIDSKKYNQLKKSVDDFIEFCSK